MNLETIKQKRQDWMSTDKPKRQHYVPRFLLKNFCDSEGCLWVGDREEGKIWPGNPDNNFLIKDLYTEHIFDPKTGNLSGKSYKHDEAIQKLEGASGTVVKEIIRKVRSKACPELSQKDSDIFKQFMFLMARRTPESQQRLIASKSFEDNYYEVAKELAEAQNYPLPDKDTLFQDIEVIRLAQKIEHNVDARFAAGDDNRLFQEEEKFCRKTGLWIAGIGIPKRSFVIGSHGITIFKMGEEEHSCLPISHDIVVLASPYPDEETLVTLGRDEDRLIRKINTATASQSRWVAGCSEQLVRSLMDTVSKQ